MSPFLVALVFSTFAMTSLHAALDRYCGLQVRTCTETAPDATACISPTAPLSTPVEFCITYWHLSPFFAQLGQRSPETSIIRNLTFPKHMLPYLVIDTIKDAVVVYLEQAHQCHVRRRDIMLRCPVCRKQHRYEDTLSDVWQHTQQADVVELACQLSEQGHLSHRTWLL